MLCFGLLSSAHHPPRCCLEIQTASPHHLQGVFCLLSSVVYICDSGIQSTARSLHPPRSLYATAASQSFKNFSASNQYLQRVLRQPQLAAGADAAGSSARTATAPSIPGGIFLLSFKTMCESLLCRNSSLSKFKDD